MRLEAAEEKATEAEFQQSAVREKMCEKHRDDTIKSVTLSCWNLLLYSPA